MTGRTGRTCHRKLRGEFFSKIARPLSRKHKSYSTVVGETLSSPPALRPKKGTRGLGLVYESTFPHKGINSLHLRPISFHAFLSAPPPPLPKSMETVTAPRCPLPRSGPAPPVCYASTSHDSSSAACGPRYSWSRKAFRPRCRPTWKPPGSPSRARCSASGSAAKALWEGGQAMNKQHPISRRSLQRAPTRPAVPATRKEKVWFGEEPGRGRPSVPPKALRGFPWLATRGRVVYRLRHA